MRKGRNTYLKSTAKKLSPSFFLLPSVKTAEVTRIKKPQEKARRTVAFFALLFTVGAVISSKTAVTEAFNTASFFVRSALPAMLPFTVASAILIKSGFGETCRKTVGAAFPKLFGISGAAAAPFILGAIAGFPIGTKTVAELYDQGECDLNDAEKALALCSNPGFGFTVAGVGGVMWGDRLFGLAAWLSCLTSSVIIGIIAKIFEPKKLSRSHSAIHKKQPLTEPYSVSKTVSDSVKEASVALLAVFAFVVFFSTVSTVLVGALTLLPFAEQSPILNAVTNAFFEFSSGVSAISQLKSDTLLPTFTEGANALVTKLITVSTLAWSGISVHMQTRGITAPYGINMKRYYRRKLASALLAPICFLLMSNLFVK